MIANNVRGELDHHLLLDAELCETNARLKALPAPPPGGPRTPRDVLAEQTRIEAQRAADRHDVEQKKIADTLGDFGMSAYEAEDEGKGIRCLSHMRDRALSDDAKKPNELLRSEPVFTTRESIAAETEAWIRTKYPSFSFPRKVVAASREGASEPISRAATPAGQRTSTPRTEGQELVSRREPDASATLV